VNLQFWSVVVLLVVAVALGGGGSKYGLLNLTVQLAALAALALNRQAFMSFWSQAGLILKLLVGLTLLLPFLHLFPLPLYVWTDLPGRELVEQSFALTGGTRWFSISVDPARTGIALSALIIPIAMLTIGWSLSRNQLVHLGWIAVFLGLGNVLIGIPQAMSVDQTGSFYPEIPMPGVLFGTFANRNSTGLFLVGCLALATLLPMPARLARFEWFARIAIGVLLLVAVVLTRSRTALVLAALPLIALGLKVALQWWGSRKAGPHASPRRIWVAVAALVLTLGTLAALVVASPGRVSDVIERFDSDQADARLYIWEDAVYSAERYWPVGAGMGAFRDVFQVDESLENITQRRAGRAHNDYLELAIEAGLPGLILLFAWFVLIAAWSVGARRRKGRWIAWSGTLILSTIALQSITDYPLRNLSMLAFASLALLLLARFSAPSKGARA
jgi:O-antigen ligase